MCVAVVCVTPETRPPGVRSRCFVSIKQAIALKSQELLPCVQPCESRHSGDIAVPKVGFRALSFGLTAVSLSLFRLSLYVIRRFLESYVPECGWGRVAGWLWARAMGVRGKHRDWPAGNLLRHQPQPSTLASTRPRQRQQMHTRGGSEEGVGGELLPCDAAHRCLCPRSLGGQQLGCRCESANVTEVLSAVTVVHRKFLWVLALPVIFICLFFKMRVSYSIGLQQQQQQQCFLQTIQPRQPSPRVGRHTDGG